MKKVLIITYMPYASPRIPGIAKYLPGFGWQPVIMTPLYHQEEGGELKIIETPYKDSLSFLRKLLGIKPDEDDMRKQVKERFGIKPKNFFMDTILTVGGAIVNYPDSQKGWKPFAISQGKKLLEKEKIDVIISSSSPVTGHIIANELKDRYKIPWLADLRDLWSQNFNYYYGALRKLFDRRLELKTLSKADALITVSEPWAEELRALHKREVVYTITNGFDPEKINEPPADLTSKFTITYTGLIYTGKQDPSKLFTALRELISEGILNPNQIEVRFYGPEINWSPEEIEKYGLSAIVKYYGIVPREIAFEKQRESQSLLLLNWEDQRIRGWHPLKGFEYLAARRPILAIGGSGNDVTKKLLDETKAGMYCRTVEDIKSTLSELYSEYKLTGKVSYNGDIAEINKYSHRDMARRFAEILDHITRR